MKKGSIQKLGIVFLLTLVLFQQVGAGLYIHNIFHSGKERLAHAQHDESSKEISFACSCVDNFLTPLVESEELVFDAPRYFRVIPDSSFSESIYFFSVDHPTLRGPPVFIG